MNDKNLLRTGIAGIVATALCCVTPILVITLGALGFSAAVGWLDFVLFPMLAGFLGMAGYALHRRGRSSS